MSTTNQTFEVYRKKSLLPGTVLLCLFKGFLPILESPDIKEFMELGEDKSNKFGDIVNRWSQIGFMEVDLYEVHRCIDKQYATITETYADQTLSHAEINNRVEVLTEELYRQMLHRQSIMLHIKAETLRLIKDILAFADTDSEEPVFVEPFSKHSDIQSKLQSILLSFTNSVSSKA